MGQAVLRSGQACVSKSCHLRTLPLTVALNPLTVASSPLTMTSSDQILFKKPLPQAPLLAHCYIVGATGG
jgi:hypothetical protein